MSCDYEAAAKGGHTGCSADAPASAWADRVVEFSAAHHLMAVTLVVLVAGLAWLAGSILRHRTTPVEEVTVGG